MTPEKRAENVVGEWERSNGPPTLEQRIASAIREAEDEALERAAQLVDGAEVIDGDDGDGMGGVGVAISGDDIRSLKHKKGT